MKRHIQSFLAVLSILAALPVTAAANPKTPAPVQGEMSPKTYEVTYPKFQIMINGAPMYNGKAMYPVMMYDGMVYFPMTWRYTQALGLDTQWDPVDGFAISKSGKPASKLVNDTAILSARHFYAKLPSFQVRVNNHAIDNANEPYPVLVFNDITYFPMTWRFAVEQLGLEIKMEKDKYYISKASVSNK
ncbi:hypothetical protein [Paenibacillus piri]|uniref:Copper amine oxidase-like N-terminal domain-containing protein n=1 Tax=Paenibacillus piri TaxID=2547395 RepID=A0A4R5KUU3_9BACL|nr:hypothetical protein [Paenibacillus piri]TDF99292.1 hypothetical protein E1757_05375 [Paenibacillus piri]